MDTGPSQLISNINEDQRRLEVFDNDCQRRIMSRRRLDRVLCAVNSIFELCLLCFFSVDFVGLGMLRDVLPAKSSVGARSVAANSKRW